ncbi:MAG: hypothetical protein A2293_16545 [Elusimicrobia bacterium RIFOXYB2_FULL_49_7]|nr:MAG: hypothetical protein A2293_16545 [Elusimicrobia bacterium RIFOXYB2_FULL_49_7]
MNIALVNPPWIHLSNASAVRAGSRWPHIRHNYFHIFPFPYRLAEATSSLIRAGHNAILVDSLAEGLTIEQTLHRCKGCSFFIVETATNSLPYDIKFLKSIKAIFPEVIIACVGQHAAVGENDLTPFCNFVLPYEYDQKVLNIANGFPPGDDIVDINHIPWPFRDPKLILSYQEGFCTHFPNATVTISRGCPYACSFCQEPTVYYNKSGRRIRNPIDVVDEWQYLISHFNLKELYIDDATFNADEDYLNAILDEYERRNMRIFLSAMGDARISNKLLERLSRNGFTGLKIGVESIHPHILKGINKSWLKINDIERVVTKCRELNIFIHGTFILGLPGDNVDTIRQTIDYALKTNFSFIQFSPFIPLPGTKIYDEIRKLNWRFETNTDNNIFISRPELSATELCKLYKYAQSRINKRVFSSLYLIKKYLLLSLFLKDWHTILLMIVNRFASILKYSSRDRS